MPIWPRVRIAGIDVTVASMEDCEKCAIMVCAPWASPSRFSDDVRAVCEGCGGAIRHRPQAPRTPMKLCSLCAIGWVKRQ